MAVKWLIDNALSFRFSDELVRLGHDAVHMRKHLPANATDAQVLELAANQGRCVVSMDADFGTLLAATGAATPSFLMFRTTRRATPQLVAALVDVLPQVEADLARGAVVVIADDRVRIRPLPLA